MLFSVHVGNARKIMTDRLLQKQLLRFVLVGLATNVVGFGLYLFVTGIIGVGPKTTVSILYPVGALMGYFGNRQWTFSHRGHLLGSSFRYVVAHAFGYLLNILLLLIFVDRLRFPHQLVQAVSILIVALFLFVMFRVFVFPAASESDGSAL